VLLCSDGLSDLVPSEEIARIALAFEAYPQRVVDKLVEAALAAGGKDNVSVIFATAMLPPRRGGARVERERGAGFLSARWLQIALAALAGAALALALAPTFEGRRPVPLPVMTAEVAPPRALQVGPRERFRTITDALAAARPGDSVVVAPGTYREQVRLGDGVSLIAAVPRQAVLLPVPSGGESEAVVAVVAERLGSGRIEGFTIRGEPRTSFDIGIRVSDAAVAIEDVAVSGARLAGVVFEGSRGASLSASRVHDNPGAGVMLRRGATARLAHDLIENNGHGRPRSSAGVELERGAHAELQGNTIVGNQAGGVRGAPLRTHAALFSNNRFGDGSARRDPHAVIVEPAR
jgi:hypothetical protein